ncbi:RcnB family protein [Acinetobacter bouvetii]|uniref:RcnB family protein n=1 Tax=Acinetobacter bouvetii TaxID=202951 RepID=A0A811GE11_9GAMM|nr:RcnB family protein [Acinetobacter bouvetii]CAB1220024.1 hypothetical protein SFB21_2497 [Acinetobacter bouvetii]
MNTLVKAIVFSLSTALVTAPAMAAPQEHNQSHQVQNQQKGHTQSHQNTSHKNTAHKKAVNPSHDWKVGQKVPSQYHGQGYKIDHKKFKKLSKPGKNQQWIKVNADYVLTNVISHTIIKIIGG